MFTDEYAFPRLLSRGALARAADLTMNNTILCISLILLVYFSRIRPLIGHTIVKPFILILLLGALTIPGCLTVESKEYRIILRSDNSGEATIRFVNIMSESDDTTDVAADDFQQLIEFYLEGTQLENENPGFRNVKKRLFEQQGVLMGEISFTFDSLGAVRLFRFDRSSPYMYFSGSPLSSEQLIETNGTRGPDWLPVVFWPKDATEFYIKTRVSSEVPYRRSLVQNFQEWEQSRQSRDKQ